MTLDDLGELIADDEPRIRCDGLQRIVSTSFAHASSMPRGVGLDSSGTRVAVHTTYSELEAVKMDDLRASLNQRITARIALLWRLVLAHPHELRTTQSIVGRPLRELSCEIARATAAEVGTFALARIQAIVED